MTNNPNISPDNIRNIVNKDQIRNNITNLEKIKEEIKKIEEEIDTREKKLEKIKDLKPNISKVSSLINNNLAYLQKLEKDILNAYIKTSMLYKDPKQFREEITKSIVDLEKKDFFSKIVYRIKYGSAEKYYLDISILREPLKLFLNYCLLIENIIKIIEKNKKAIDNKDLEESLSKKEYDSYLKSLRYFVNNLKTIHKTEMSSLKNDIQNILKTNKLYVSDKKIDRIRSELDFFFRNTSSNLQNTLGKIAYIILQILNSLDSKERQIKSEIENLKLRKNNLEQTLKTNILVKTQKKVPLIGRQMQPTIVTGTYFIPVNTTTPNIAQNQPQAQQQAQTSPEQAQQAQPIAQNTEAYVTPVNTTASPYVAQNQQPPQQVPQQVQHTGVYFVPASNTIASPYVTQNQQPPQQAPQQAQTSPEQAQQAQQVQQPAEQPAQQAQPTQADQSQQQAQTSPEQAQQEEKIKKSKKIKAFFKKFKTYLEEEENATIVNIIQTIIFIIFLLLTFIVGNLALIFIFLIVFTFFGLIGRKSISWILSWAAIGALIMFVIYIFVHTTFSRVVCVFVPSLCPERVVRTTDKQLESIKLSIEETIKKINYIMQNPELAYIESRAEAEATREAYRYLFEIQSTNEVPINYIFYSKNDEIINISSIPIYYAIRYAFPVDRKINITFNAYCLTEISFKKECILTSTLSNLGTIVRYNRKEVFFNRDLNLHGPVKISDNYGMTSVRCAIPKFSVNISNCTELTFGSFYINNLFLFLISNVTTRTIYKFLVIDESTLIKSIIEGKDIYDYLKLNRYEYDKGYFEGFLDFPKINILRLGVLSEYPVIKFRNASNISDFIYVSLSNIKEMHDIKKIEIEIIYDPKYLEIDLDPNFSGIHMQLYDFNCSKRRDAIQGAIYCNATFRNRYDDFNRNLYIIYYKESSDKLFFFIPIIISFSGNFTEYAEVIVSARAEYDIEKVESAELEYRMVEISI